MKLNSEKLRNVKKKIAARPTSASSDTQALPSVSNATARKAELCYIKV